MFYVIRSEEKKLVLLKISNISFSKIILYIVLSIFDYKLNIRLDMNVNLEGGKLNGAEV